MGFALVEKGRYNDARDALNILRNQADQEGIDQELRVIQDAIQNDHALGDVSWKSIITKRSWRRRLLLGCGIQSFAALSGINVINYFGPRIYGILGITTQESLLIIGIGGVLSILYCSFGLWILDRIGRVKPLIISAAGRAATILINAVQAQYLNENNVNQLRSMVAMNFLFSFFYTPLGITSWVYPAEIFPVEVRALGNAISVFSNWTINLVFAQFTPAALTRLGFSYFYVFFVFNLVAMVCYILFYPETKGRTLEQMDELFSDHLNHGSLEDPATKFIVSKEPESAQHCENKGGKQLPDLAVERRLAY
ncbi:hexose carrier protein [Ilyonectria robusta]